jgi:hypothetical protein
MALAKEERLTQAGVDKAAAVNKLLAALKAGVPFSRRKKTDPKKLSFRYLDQRSELPPWVTSSVANKVFTTNRDVMIFGTPDPWMAANKKKGLGPNVLKLFTSMGKSDYHEVVPAWFQTDGLIEPEFSWIWLQSPDTSEGPTVRLMVATHYFDYLVDRFPTCRFFAPEGVVPPIQLRVTNKGITKLNIVAILMPVRVPEDWAIPGGGDA